MKEFKSKICFFAVLLIFMQLTGCLLYTDIKAPMPSLSIQTTAKSMSKVGQASCSSYLWLVAVGDCSTTAAMKNGDISKIHHVDYKGKSFLFGLYIEDTLTVYGE